MQVANGDVLAWERVTLPPSRPGSPDALERAYADFSGSAHTSEDEWRALASCVSRKLRPVHAPPPTGAERLRFEALRDASCAAAGALARAERRAWLARKIRGREEMYPMRCTVPDLLLYGLE